VRRGLTYECGQDAHLGKLAVTRMMNGFSKKLENYEATVALYFMYYNFAAFTRTLRVTPAMEAGVTDHEIVVRLQ
jgi:hypothetical protein